MKLQNHVLVWLRCYSLIPLLTRDNSPNATSGVNNITLPTWDQIYVCMEDCLTSRYFFVDTTIEACDCLR